MLFFFPRDVLDEILNLIESVSEGFPSYSCQKFQLRHTDNIYKKIMNNLLKFYKFSYDYYKSLYGENHTCITKYYFHNFGDILSNI